MAVWLLPPIRAGQGHLLGRTAGRSTHPVAYLLESSDAILQGGPKTGTLFCEPSRHFIRLNFIKYCQIIKLISLSESGEHL